MANAPKPKNLWTHMSTSAMGDTYRMPVPGGWVYRHNNTALCFVPDPKIHAPLGRLQTDPHPETFTTRHR